MNNVLYASLCDNFITDTKPIDSCSIYFTNGKSSTLYTGEIHNVPITVKDVTKTLEKNVDYIVTVVNDKNMEMNLIQDVGTYIFKIIGINKYEGIASIKFNVVGNNSKPVIKNKQNDMYNTYDDVTFEFNDLFSFDKRNLSYLQMISKADEEWVYPTSETETKIVGVVVIKDALSDGEYLQLSLYNFRLEEVVSVTTTEIKNNEAIFSVDNKNLKLLLPDIYYYSVSLYNKNNEKIETIKDIDDEHFFYVKDNKECLQ